jgi:hypothetical protein
LSRRLKAVARYALLPVSLLAVAVAAATGVLSGAATACPGVHGARATTRPPGAAVLTDSAAACLVRRSAFEPRAANGPFNQRVATSDELRHFRALNGLPVSARWRVTGNFRGTTDEIIQWAAWKWGINADVLRAIATRESDWRQSFVGDGGRSVGLMQVKVTASPGTGTVARQSTAFNLDFYGAVFREYYDGAATWLNSVSGNGRPYHAGDFWGSVGAWFSGRWRDEGARRYISQIQSELARRAWLTPGF